MSHRPDKRGSMRASLVDTSLRVLTWGCVILLAILSLLPDQQMVRSGLPGRLEHFVAYAGSRPCENVREPRERRIVFSIAFFVQPSPELLAFRLIHQIEKNFLRAN
jgi:hypothetical protein